VYQRARDGDSGRNIFKRRDAGAARRNAELGLLTIDLIHLFLGMKDVKGRPGCSLIVSSRVERNELGWAFNRFTVSTTTLFQLSSPLYIHSVSHLRKPKVTAFVFQHSNPVLFSS